MYLFDAITTHAMQHHITVHTHKVFYSDYSVFPVNSKKRHFLKLNIPCRFASVLSLQDGKCVSQTVLAEMTRISDAD